MSVGSRMPSCAAVGRSPSRRCTGSSPRRSPGPSFRVEVNYVESTPSVTDAQGNVVTDLTADDFEVLEDGRPQKVDGLFVRQPADRARRAAAVRGASRSRRTSRRTSSVEGRVYLIVLDDLHTDPTRACASRRRRDASSSRTSAPTTWPRSPTRAAAPATRRTSRTTRACC